jgi:hypothetical protein
MLNAAGSSYDVTAAATAGVPFRPYFKLSGSGVKEFKDAKSIGFTRAGASLGGDDDAEPDEYLDGELTIWGSRGFIYVLSGLNEETKVRIVNTGGALVNSFTIEPGKTVRTQAAPGVYIVNNKKVTVR